MPRRYPNPRLAKIHRSYTVEEAASLYGVHKNSVRSWLGRGLQAIDDRRPLMISGNSLNGFHAARRQSAKRPCGPAEIYCVPCRKPQRPAGDIVEYTKRDDRIGQVSGICPDCGRLLFQSVNEARLSGFRLSLEVVETKHSLRI